MSTAYETVTSKDGTTIAYAKSGSGPAVILIGGMFEQRESEYDTAKLAAFPLMNENFTVYNYDRRGRGDSTDTQPYAPQREVEDIEALIDAAGGEAFLSGISSGAALAFEAASALGDKVRKLAMYDPPYNDDPDAKAMWVQFRKDVQIAIDEDRRGDAVAAFMMSTGASAEDVNGMREMPFFAPLEAIAPTIAYDAAVIGEEAAVPVDRAAALNIPVLLMNGENSYPFMQTSGQTLANTFPNVQYKVLAGQVHEVEPDAIAPELVAFFTSN
jgi:pimeloyl-ACP methyl ester carboxylesterase